jgi:hypothetical protein
MLGVGAGGPLGRHGSEVLGDRNPAAGSSTGLPS